jgi:hypothetical protein
MAMSAFVEDVPINPTSSLAMISTSDRLVGELVVGRESLVVAMSKSS